MRPVDFGNPPVSVVQQPQPARFILDALREIEKASAEADVGELADDFTVTNFTETYSLNAATATATDVADVLATFINGLKKRGAKRK